MSLARHGEGPTVALRALGSQVHPVFMLPPVATALFGAVLAARIDPLPTAVHATAIFAAVYTAHVKDGYVDFHGRGEDADHPLTVAGCRVALAGSTALFLACLGGLWVLAGPLAVALTAPTWLIAYLHAPTLDLHPVGATMGYPGGIALALLGGFATQTGTLGVEPVIFAGVFLLLLSGVKVIDDASDHRFDRSIDKRTVAVVLGRRDARRLAYGLVAAGLVATALAGWMGVVARGVTLAAIAFAVVAGFAARTEPPLATMLLVRGAYVYLAVLVAVSWWRPLG